LVAHFVEDQLQLADRAAVDGMRTGCVYRRRKGDRGLTGLASKHHTEYYFRQIDTKALVTAVISCRIRRSMEARIRSRNGGTESVCDSFDDA
jgi:hypothetical protein